MTSSRVWRLVRSAPVRADADGVFVPVTDLRDATVGDLVTLEGSHGDRPRTGVIVERTEGPDQAFFRLELEAPSA